jgi:hypothetical protein
MMDRCGKWCDVQGSPRLHRRFPQSMRSATRFTILLMILLTIQPTIQPTSSATSRIARRSANRLLLCALGLTLVCGSAIHAQSPAASRPTYRSLRFDERWTAGARSPAWDDAIKAVPLWPDVPVTVTFAGQLRWREEFVRAFALRSLDDDHGQSRIQLSADVQLGSLSGTNGRLFVEARDAQSFGRTLPGGARPTDADRHDVQNLFAEVGRGASYLRVGRQEIAINRERMFGVPDWANTRRGSEGARLHVERGRFAFEAIDARPVVVRQQAPNRADSTARFRVLSLGSSSAAPALARGVPATWQGCWVEQVVRGPTVVTRRLTTGARTMWQRGETQGDRRYSFELEGAVQRGRSGDAVLRSWFWVAESVVQWPRQHGAPSLALGVEHASGERPETNSVREVFTTLYPAAHAHGGYADVIGRANARELHLIGTWSPVRPLALRAALYRFDRLRTDDGVWTKQNSVFRPADGSTVRHVADEFDLTGTWRAGRHLRLIAGGAVVRPGAFLTRSADGAQQERWAFVGTTFTF